MADDQLTAFSLPSDMPPWLMRLIAGGWNPLQPQPAETGELPQQTLGRKPSGSSAPYNPLSGGSANTGLPALAPMSRAAPLAPPVAPRPVIDPARVDLGTYQNPRFTTIDRPNAPAAGNARGGGGPLTMGALDLSGLFRRP